MPEASLYFWGKEFLNQSIFRPIKHLKMTIWISVLWKMNIQMAKKWPEMVVQLPFMSQFHFESDHSTLISESDWKKFGKNWPVKETDQKYALLYPAGNALEREQQVHAPADLRYTTFCTLRILTDFITVLFFKSHLLRKQKKFFMCMW